MKEKELEEQIGDVFARACKNNEYFGNDGWYELHTPTARQEIKALIAQERRKAKIEELGELLEFISYDEGFEPTRQLLQDRLAELKEDKERKQ